MSAQLAPVTPPPEALTSSASRLTLLYVLALSAVACLSIVGQVLVQWSLGRQQSDSTVVNVAGRQRMLSQELTKAALALQLAKTPSEIALRRQEIAEALEQWRQADAGLRQGSPDLGLPGGNSPAIEQQLALIEPHFAAMAQAARSMLDADGSQPEALATLLAHERSFLAAMDDVVRQYEEEARERVAWLKQIERGLLGLTLLVLACEGAFIFRPAVNSIQSAAHAMLESRRQLELAKLEAESANRAKSQFLATVSHELRNPLQAILGSVDLAQCSVSSADQSEHWQTISTAARSLLALLNDLLDLARIEAGKLEINSTLLDPILVSERALAMIAPQAQARGLALERELPADLSPGLHGDEQRIGQVLLNLLGNAVKFTPSGRVKLRLAVARDDLRQIRLRWEVSDTGLGIPPEKQGVIFEAFAQVAGSTEQSLGGAGLGLAICQRIVNLMQGQIGVASAPGRGSTFWFELPLAKVSCTSHAVALPKEQNDAHQPLRVLVVDDDPVNRRLLGQMLELMQHVVCFAANGAEALARMREETFDAALIDWQMPGMDGGQLAAAIRDLERELGRNSTRLIALSAGVGKGSDRRDRFEQFLTKPVGIDKLRTALLAQREQIGDLPRNGADSETPAERWAPVLARLQGRRELLSQLAESYRAGLPDLLSQLHESCAARDTQEVARLAHVIAGQAGQFSAADLVASAQQLETQAQAGSFDVAATSDLCGQCRDLERELEAYPISHRVPGRQDQDRLAEAVRTQVPQDFRAAASGQH